MHFNNIKDELQDVLQGKSSVSHGELIQAIIAYLRKSPQAGTMAERNEPNKSEETQALIKYINSHKLYIYHFLY